MQQPQHPGGRAKIRVILYKKDGFKSEADKTVELDKQGPGTLSLSEVPIKISAPGASRMSGTATLTRAAGDSAGSVTAWMTTVESSRDSISR